MISLIKNELKKIFSKKALYVVLFIAIAICIIANIMNKRFDHRSLRYTEQEIEIYQSQLENAKEIGDEEYARTCQSYLEARTIASKYDDDSWQRYIIANKLEQVINDMIRTEGTEGYEIYKEEYDRIVECLEKDDWKVFAQEELEEINTQLQFTEDEEMKENLNNQKQVLEWRLEKIFHMEVMTLIHIYKHGLVQKQILNS